MKGYNTAKVAKVIGVSKNTLLRWLYEGKLKEPRRVKAPRQEWRVWTKKDIRRARKLRATMRHGPKPLAEHLEYARTEGTLVSQAYTTQQIADALGVHKRTLFRWLENGQLREPRRVRFNGLSYRVWFERDLKAARKYKEKFYRKGKARSLRQRR